MTLTDLQIQISALSSEVLSSPVRLFESVINSYESIRIIGASLDEDGDMLLFQWGSYDWGQGRQFDLDLTRQVIPSGQDDPPIVQLHCTYSYGPTAFEEISSGNLWCQNPAEIDAFRAYVLESIALRRAASQNHMSIAINIGDSE